MSDQTVTTKTAPKAMDRDSRLSWQNIVGAQEIGILTIFLIWCGFLSVYTDTFLTPTNIFNMLRAFSWIAIAAFGQCMVILTAGIDLSVGSNMALSGLAAAWLLTQGVPVPLAVIG